MKSFLYAWRFGWPFVRQYKTRLFIGVGLGVLFGLSNVFFIFAMKTLFERLGPAPTEQAAEVVQVESPASSPSVSADAASVADSWQHWKEEFETRTAPIKQKAKQLTETMLPRWGEPITGIQIAGLILLLPALALLRGSLGYAASYFMKWVSERVLNDMRFFMVKKINSLSLNYFTRSTTGDLTKRINGDTDAVYYFVNLGVTDLIKEPTTLLAISVTLLWLDWQLLAISALILPATIIPVKILGKKVKKASEGKNVTQIKFSSLLVEMIANVRMIKAFNLQNLMEKRFFEYRKQLIGFNMRMNKATEMINPLIESFSSIGIGLILVFVFVTQRQIPDVVAFMTGLALAANPIKKLTKVHLYIQRAEVSIRRLQETMSEVPAVAEPVKPRPLSSFTTSIRYNQVGFAYGDIPVLEDCTVEIPKGASIGLAGESGSGKSTFINLLFRFYDPTHGTVSIDGIPMTEIHTNDIRNQMALVSQDVLLFDDTVAANIALGRIGATRAEIEEAAKAAHAHEFIMNMPQGYDTRIGERGVMISGGQRQRLSIARAFVRNAPILVLDEATASLDSQSEEEVQKAIDDLAANRTVVMVAHRLSTLRKCDTILVLSKGRIIERGSYDQLLRSGGSFASMAMRQGIHPTANTG